MHAERHHHHSHHGCNEPRGYSQSRGPEMFYGYCHDSGTMRMMDYPDYLSNAQTTYSNLYSGAASTAQPYIDMMMGRAPATGRQSDRGRERDWHRHHGDCGCGCHHEDCGCHDCLCDCRIRCADVVEYARCGEVRRIPITFENETRREREVKLHLGGFATESGHEPGWPTELSDREFKLPPCGEKTVIVTVTVDCGKVGDSRTAGTVDSCKVAYATLRADGCTVCPLVIAVAVLPNDCGAHHTGCLCSCCC